MSNHIGFKRIHTSLITFSLFCVVAASLNACKPAPGKKKAPDEAIGVIDRRPNSQGSANSNQVDASPFPADAFPKPCTRKVFSSEDLPVTVSFSKFPSSVEGSKRTAVWEKEVIKGLFKADKGQLVIPGILGGNVKIGGENVGKIYLGEFEIPEEGEQTARGIFSRPDLITATRMTSPDAALYVCAEGLKPDSSYDASDITVRQNAALSAAASVGKAYRIVNTYVTNPRYAEMFGQSKNLGSVGFSALQEVFVDYEYTAFDSQSSLKKRFVNRIDQADNLAYNAGFEMTGGIVTSTRSYEVFPHSKEYMQDAKNKGVFWGNSLLLSHEFGHHIYNETVARVVHAQTGDSGVSSNPSGILSLSAIESFIQKTLKGTSSFSKRSFFMESPFRKHWPLAKPSGKSPSLEKLPGAQFQLQDGIDNAPSDLSPVQRAELTRRVEFSQLAVNEGLADITAAAVTGTYSQFYVKCVGPDRDPSFNFFGGGKDSQKAIPAGISLFKISESDSSWNIQQSGGDKRSQLAPHSDCSISVPVTLASAYTVTSILTNWIENSLLEMTGKSFVQLEESERVELALDAFRAVQPAYGPWLALLRKSYSAGDFDVVGAGVPAIALLTAAEGSSLAPTVATIGKALFDTRNPDSWLSRHAATPTKPSGVPIKAAISPSTFCDIAIKKRLTTKEFCS